MADLATDNSATGVVDNSATEPTNSSYETGATSGQVGTEVPTEATPTDLFKGVDPNKLPPEARAAYNSMLTDYRDKTARLAETVKSQAAKEAAAYKEKATYYDQIAQQEEFVKQWNEYVQKTQTQTPGTNEQGDPVLSQMKQQLQEMNQKIQMSEMSQITESFAEAANEKGEPLHPDFDALNNIMVGKANVGNQVEEFSLLRVGVELASGNTPMEKLANGYKTAKAIRDQIFEEGKKAGMGRLQTKMQNSSNPPSNSTGDLMSMTDKKPKSAREALDMARKGLVVSREN